MNKFVKWIFIGIVFLPVLSWSQPAWTIYNTTNSPLPENSVRCIEIAPDGKKWIGTDYGLASFDDVSWTVYTTFNSGLPDNSIRSIAIDSTGIIWIGTFSSGLVKFDGTNWTNFTTFNSDIPDDFVRSIVIDTLNNKWVGTIGGLGFYDDADWYVYNTSNASIGSNNISALLVDPLDNSLTIGTINGGMTIANGPIWNHYTIWNSNLPDNSILGLDRDTSGTLWLATPSAGLTAYIGGFAFLTFNTISSAIQSNSLTDLSIDNSNDNNWIASNDSGIIRKSNLFFNSFNTFNSPMPDNFVQTVTVESSGIIWIGTQIGGLVRLDESLLTSVKPVTQITSMKIFPQPASDHLNVYYDKKRPAQIEIFDMNMSKIVLESIAFEENKAVLQLSSLPSGVYLMKMVFSDGSYSGSKFLVGR